ncbi:MAG: hypothetical protein COB54_00915 [Alphaproteobacteria bacterium]|nr:MAG: hypothetical protein COB54_00915 [Alphaproteobacteria bacterium]
MTKIFPLMTVIFTLIVTSTVGLSSQAAQAKQFSTTTKSTIFWTIAKSDLVAKARTRLNAGKLDQARRLYRKALQTTLRISDRQAVFNDLCVLHNIQQDFDKARGYCTKAVKMSPKDWRGFNNRGLAYYGLGQHDKARQDFAQAIALNPALIAGTEQAAKAVPAQHASN